MPADDGDFTRAFNAGADARLAGQPQEACPHRRHVDSQLYRGWLAGWWDVNLHWGSEAYGQFQPLPAVETVKPDST